jgi:uncharacterized protein involved in exopolysaccharide biosynthesis/Mrp family chromosome partitioning ATPase
MQGENSIDIISIIRKFYRYRYGVVIILILVLLSTHFYIKRVNPIYLSSILIDVGDSERSDIKSLFPNSNVVNIDRESQLEYDTTILKSRHVINEVLNKIDFSKRFFVDEGWRYHEFYKKEIPFKIEFKNINPTHTSYQFILEPIDSDSFAFNLEGEEREIYRYGEEIKRALFNIKVDKKESIKPDRIKYLVKIETNRAILTSYILGNLSIKTEANRLLKISYEDSIPKRTEDIITQLVDSYQEYRLNSGQRKDREQIAILDRKIGLMENKLKKIGEKLKKYKSKNSELLALGLEESIFSDITDKDHQLATISLQLESIKATENLIKRDKYSILLLENSDIKTGDIEQLIKKLRRKREKLILLKRQQSNIYTIIVDNPSYIKMLNRLKKLKHELITLEVEFTRKHPKHQKVQRDIETLEIELERYIEKNIRSYTVDIKNIKQQIKRYLKLLEKNLKIKSKSLKQSLDKKRETINSLPNLTMKLEKLKRDFNTNENSYKILLQKRVETSISTNYISNIQIVDSATTPISPIKPKKSFIYLSGLILGIILSVIYTSFRVRVDDKVYMENDINRDTFHIISSMEQKIDNAFWMLVAYLEKSNISKKESIIVFITSDSYQEDRTLLLRKLSSNLKSISKRVLIIDFDIYNPQLKKEFNIDSELGLSNILTTRQQISAINIDECIYNLHVNIDILPSGPIVNHSSKLLFNSKIEDLLDSLSKNYDYILINSAPMGKYPITDILLQYVDTLLIVIKLKKSSIKLCEKLTACNHIEKIAFVTK